jgi:hypothetical protein
MTTKKKAVKKGNMRGWEIGAGITAATLAAAAGAYLLSDKKTKAKAKKWVAGAQKEIAKKATLAKKLGEKEYGHIVDQVVKHHGSLENLTAADIIAAGGELKGKWERIQAEAKKMGKMHTPKSAAKKKKPVHKAKPAKKARG